MSQGDNCLELGCFLSLYGFGFVSLVLQGLFLLPSEYFVRLLTYC